MTRMEEGVVRRCDWGGSWRTEERMGKEVEKMKRIWQPNDLGKVGVERRGVVARMT